MRIGPDVALFSSELVIEADVLRIEVSGGEPPGAFLSAGSILANYLQRIEGSPEILRVYSNNLPPVLHAFKHELRTSRGRFVPFQRFLDLRTILMSFRPSHTRSGVSVLAAKMDSKIVGFNQHRSAILAELMRRGSIRLEGKWYLLELNELGTLGFGMKDFLAGEPSNSMLEFLSSCSIEEN